MASLNYYHGSSRVSYKPNDYDAKTKFGVSRVLNIYDGHKTERYGLTTNTNAKLYGNLAFNIENRKYFIGTTTTITYKKSNESTVNRSGFKTYSIMGDATYSTIETSTTSTYTRSSTSSTVTSKYTYGYETLNSIIGYDTIVSTTGTQWGIARTLKNVTTGTVTSQSTISTLYRTYTDGASYTVTGYYLQTYHYNSHTTQYSNSATKRKKVVTTEDVKETYTRSLLSKSYEGYNEYYSTTSNYVAASPDFEGTYVKDIVSRIYINSYTSTFKNVTSYGSKSVSSDYGTKSSSQKVTRTFTRTLTNEYQNLYDEYKTTQYVDSQRAGAMSVSSITRAYTTVSTYGTKRYTKSYTTSNSSIIKSTTSSTSNSSYTSNVLTQVTDGKATTGSITLKSSASMKYHTDRSITGYNVTTYVDRYLTAESVISTAYYIASLYTATVTTKTNYKTVTTNTLTSSYIDHYETRRSTYSYGTMDYLTTYPVLTGVISESLHNYEDTKPTQAIRMVQEIPEILWK